MVQLPATIAASLTVESFLGHRIWRLVPLAGQPILASATSGDPWPKVEAQATCLADVLFYPPARRIITRLHPGESSPAVGCTCGLYASKRPVAPPTGGVWALGRVRMWGRVIEGTKGFRAQRARLVDELAIHLGTNPTRLSCTLSPCRDPAIGVWVGSASFLLRCGRHGRGRMLGLGQFESWVDSSFRRRYGRGAAIVSR